MKKIFIVLTSCGLALNYASAQTPTLYNQSKIYVAGTGILYVNGGITTTGANDSLINEGDVYAKLATSNGDFTIDTNAVVIGNGTYYVDNDWINNANFIAQSSDVQLKGTNQLITGDSVTTFNNLTLFNSGAVKTQTIDAKIGANGILTFNDPQIELATNINTMFVENPAVGAIVTTGTLNNTSFVSSTTPGTLSRNTNTTDAYLFPTGSSIGTLRYRPTIMTPASATPTTYTDRLVNNDPNIDGYNRNQNDSLECEIDSLFYHDISRTAGTTNADLTFYYLQSADGTYNGNAHWQTGNSQWTDMGTMLASTNAGFNTLNTSNWAFTTPGFPYALTTISPTAPTIMGDSILCIGQSSVTFTASGGNGTYVWSLPPGVSVIDSTANTITVNWGTGIGIVSVVSTSPGGGCVSSPASFNVGVYPSPTAYGYADTNNVWPNTPIQFEDSSKINITAWNWNFGDGDSSAMQNPGHSFGNSGTYDVLLQVTNQYGCTDTALVQINIIEGIFIPNVFTPDGDGINDKFYVSGGGFTDFSINIFNRWGSSIFKADAPQIAWDGTTNAGKKCSAGTYYFTLKAHSKTKDYSTTGYVTLFR